MITMELLKSGQKLSIFFQKEENIVEIACTIAQILEDRVVVDLPSYFMRYIEYLEVGCRLTVKAFSKIGTIDFNTIVISSPLEDEFSVELDYNALKLTPADEAPIIDTILTLNAKKEDSLFKASAFEISTSYLKFTSDYTVNEGDVIDCEIVLPKNYGIITFKGVITNVDPVYDNEFTVSYITMSERNRQDLLYYMYLYSNNSD